jgi:hypothetical protein
MEIHLDGESSILHAQVRRASAEDGYDSEMNLRSANHPAVSKKIWLGDVCKTLIRVVAGNSTPLVVEAPVFDEQKWKISFSAGDLSIIVESKPYWGFGLMTRCYANTISLKGPLETRAAIILDLAASLSHNPWEISLRWMFSRRICAVEENEKRWKALINRAKEDLTQKIYLVYDALVKVKGLADVEDSNSDIFAAESDIDAAKMALSEDNAPAVMRAIARIEASIIKADPRVDIKTTVLDEAEDVLVEHVIKIDDITEVVVEHIHEEEDIPFVDLTQEEE